VKVFGFVLARKAEHSIALMCRVLEVSRSGYHAWASRPPSPRAVEDGRLTARIRELHDKRRKVYGSPRIWADLVVDDGERIGRKRVERLMRQAGLSGLITKKYKATTVRVPGVRIADDLLDRKFAASAPNRCWVADITTSERGKAGCTSSPCRTSTAAGSSAGAWPTTCAPSLSPTRCRWRSRTAGPTRD
jgi:transposase InsO family protein